MMQKLNISCDVGALAVSRDRPGNKYREAYTGNYAVVPYVGICEGGCSVTGGPTLIANENT